MKLGAGQTTPLCLLRGGAGLALRARPAPPLHIHGLAACGGEVS